MYTHTHASRCSFSPAGRSVCREAQAHQARNSFAAASLHARLMGVAREKMGKDGEEEEEVSSSTYNHPWGKSGRLKGKKKKASTTSCVCVCVAAVQQVIELCAFKKKNTLGDDNNKKINSSAQRRTHKMPMKNEPVINFFK